MDVNKYLICIVQPDHWQHCYKASVSVSIHSKPNYMIKIDLEILLYLFS